MTRTAALVAVALSLRVAAVLLSERLVVDVLRYHRVATHVLDVSWNPYLAPRLYPYPPVWVWFEAAAEWAARHWGIPFPLLVKLPVIAADVALVALLAHWGARRGGASRAAGWIYALHPVPLLVAGFHGQFEPLALLGMVASLWWLESSRRDASALALAWAIAVKSFPVLLLPVLLWALPDARARWRYAALATLPVGLLLLPYAIDDAGALARELFGYGGVADFGWVGAWRGLVWLTTGTLVRSEPRHWAAAFSFSKVLFFAGYALVLFRGAGVNPAPRLSLGGLTRPPQAPLAAPLLESSLAVLLVFQVLYGALSAQYLLWVIPLGALRPDRAFALHSCVAVVALVGFYVFLAPGVLLPASQMVFPRLWAGTLWVVGAWLTLAAAAFWLVVLWTAGRRGE